MQTSTLDLFSPLVHEEDLTPDCGIETDDICNEIQAAVRGWGCDKNKLISSLGSTMSEDRFKISLRYNEMFDKRLKDVLQKETSGDFGTAMKYLSLNPVQAECAMIKDACKGIGSNATIVSASCPYHLRKVFKSSLTHSHTCVSFLMRTVAVLNFMWEE